MISNLNITVVMLLLASLATFAELTEVLSNQSGAAFVFMQLAVYTVFDKERKYICCLAAGRIRL